MQDLIPVVSVTEFKKLTAEQIRKMKSVNVTADGSLLFTAIIPRTEYVEAQAEYLGNQSNSVGGEDYETVTSKEVNDGCSDALSREDS